MTVGEKEKWKLELLAARRALDVLQGEAKLEAGPDCLLIVNQCTHTHPTCCTGKPSLRQGLATGTLFSPAGLFGHSIPVLPYTLAAPSSLDWTLITNSALDLSRFP